MSAADLGGKGSPILPRNLSAVRSFFSRAGGK